MRCKEGAWVLPDGRYQKGKPNKSPEDGALFRTYAESLSHIVDLYLSQPNGMGTGRIARTLNTEGYPFRSEKGQPCAFCTDDVRRVLADWPAYGGFYGLGRAKDRPGYKDADPETIALSRRRALLPLEDLKRVGRLRKMRGFEQPTDTGIIHAAKAYPLAQIVRCAVCETRAVQLGDERQRTRLGGHTPTVRRYRHPNEVPCACVKKSVLADALETLFVETVLTHIAPRPDAFQRLLAHAHTSDQQDDPGCPPLEDPYAVRVRHIKRCQEQLRRLERSYQQLAIADEDYDKQRGVLLTQLAQWQAQPIEPTSVAVSLVEFITTLQNPRQWWGGLDDEGRRSLAHSLFRYLLYDLDQQRFTEWRLTEWAEYLFSLT